jgi:uncharacterized membrane protein
MNFIKTFVFAIVGLTLAVLVIAFGWVASLGRST